MNKNEELARQKVKNAGEVELIKLVKTQKDWNWAREDSKDKKKINSERNEKLRKLTELRQSSRPIWGQKNLSEIWKGLPKRCPLDKASVTYKDWQFSIFWLFLIKKVLLPPNSWHMNYQSDFHFKYCRWARNLCHFRLFLFFLLRCNAHWVPILINISMIAFRIPTWQQCAALVNRPHITTVHYTTFQPSVPSHFSTHLWFSFLSSPFFYWAHLSEIYDHCL